ncbi:hypothetical protein J3A83DRAFT_4193433 [Scleroderma citrinum]
MHRCLLLDEILVQILHWVERSTLCAIARTCHAFNEPATALIWSRLIDLWPIFRLLPAAATTWSELGNDKVDHDGPPLCITRPLTPEEWFTVKKLSERVRVLRLIVTPTPTPYTVTPKSLSFLLHPTEQDYLFPNLQTLSMQAQVTPESRNCQDYILAFLRTLVRPHLVSLDLYLDGKFYASPNALDALTSSTNVQSLRTRETPLAAEDGSDVFVFPVISEFQSLVTATIGEGSWKLLTSLAQLKKLRELSFDLCSSTSVAPIPPTCDSFPELRTLCIYFETLDMSLSFLRWALLRKLMSIRIISTDFGRTDYSIDLQELLALIPFHSSLLEHIEVDLSFSRPHQPVPWVLSGSILAPYLTLHNLRVLDLTLAPRSYSPMFTDDELEQMAEAWPLLERLCVKAYDTGWTLPTKLTFGGIMGLIKHCPSLVTFALVFDATKIPKTTISNVDGSTVENRRIQSLDVGNSPISSARQLCRR